MSIKASIFGVKTANLIKLNFFHLIRSQRGEHIHFKTAESSFEEFNTADDQKDLHKLSKHKKWRENAGEPSSSQNYFGNSS